jgi:transcription elongation factor Elf1
MKKVAYVACRKCDVKHELSKMVTHDIEEDEQGRDLVTFTCPLCGKERKSLVTVE